MLSVRASRTFVGDAPISVRAWAQLERRDFPVSVRDLLNVERRDYQGRITAGDVECSYDVTLHNSGRWFVTADFNDHGTVLGDFFVLDFAVDGGHRGIRLDHGDSALGAGDTLRMNDDGVDSWIRDHWETIRDAPLTAHLHASPDVASVISTIVLVVTGIGIITFFASPGKVQADPCPDQPPDDHGQCIRFHKVSGNGGDDGAGTPALTG